jgi:hypothetical protein
MSNHPITPPPDQIQRWEDRYFEEDENLDVMLIEAYQAGADQELEACCEALDELNDGFWSEKLRAARRPKPPSLKEQALEIIKRGEDDWQPLPEDWDTIRRALEAL